MEDTPSEISADVVYHDILAKLTPAQRLKAFLSLYWTARELKAAALRKQFPRLPEEEIQKKVREIFLYAND